MSKFLNLGISLDKVIKMATINPAKALGEDGRRGSLKPGMPADITIMKLEKGNFLGRDALLKQKAEGIKRKLTCLSLAAILAPAQGIAADSSKKSDTSWKDIAKDRGFSAEDITRLERDKVLITGETFRQVFDAGQALFHAEFTAEVTRLRELEARWEKALRTHPAEEAEEPSCQSNTSDPPWPASRAVCHAAECKRHP